MRVGAWALRFAAGAALSLAGLVGPVAAASANPRPPYGDPNAVGYIGLCNTAGRQITSGNINTTPFAWRAVSSQSAPAPYNDAWRTAILLAYQPRQGLPSGEWSGDALTASSRYTNPAHPMVAATGGDDSLKDFIEEYSPVWGGYLELRIYLGTQNAPVYSLHYPALDIQVTGDTWRSIGGGPVNCHAGTAESIETLLLPKSSTTPPATKALNPTGVRGSPGSATKLGSNATTARASRSSSRSTGSLPTVVVTIAVLLVLVASGLLIIRRRRPAFRPLKSGTSRDFSTKGSYR